MGMASLLAVFREMRWEEGGMPVIGSSLVLSWLMDHDGVMRRSDAVFSEMTCSGMSAIFIQTGIGQGSKGLVS